MHTLSAGVAQLVEHPTCNRAVEGSIPFSSKISFPISRGVSHSGQLHRTVNPTPHGSAGSNPATPIFGVASFYESAGSPCYSHCAIPVYYRVDLLKALIAELR